jgi:hypothetical protein
MFELFKEVLLAWRDGTRKLRFVIILAGLSASVGSIMLFLGDVLGGERLLRAVGQILVAIGFILALLIHLTQKTKDEVKRDKKIEAVERRVQENPKETQAAWELAQVKLENYLNRNLSQIKSIFWLTTLVMMAGFTLISVGTYEAFQDPAKFHASILSAASGVIVSFIGGTFLVIYKSTMAQAKDYVTMLERINAVGMSVQILETLNDGGSDGQELRLQTTAQVAQQLLQMYSADAARVKKPPVKKKQPKAADE